jgi:hypothetical protein
LLDFFKDNEWIHRPILKFVFLLVLGLVSIVLPPICRRIYGENPKPKGMHVPGGVFIVIGIAIIALAGVLYLASVDPLAPRR